MPISIVVAEKLRLKWCHKGEGEKGRGGREVEEKEKNEMDKNMNFFFGIAVK